MDCFGTYFTHAQTCNVTRVQSATEWTASVHTLHMPKPNVTRVQSATEWTASVHTLHMPKPNVTRLQSATQWTASVHTLHMPKPNVTRVQTARRKCFLKSKKRSDAGLEGKKQLKTLYCRVGERPGLGVYIYIHIFYTCTWYLQICCNL